MNKVIVKKLSEEEAKALINNIYEEEADECKECGGCDPVELSEGRPSAICFSGYANGKKVADVIKFFTKATDIRWARLCDMDSALVIKFPTEELPALLSCMDSCIAHECAIERGELHIVFRVEQKKAEPKKKAVPKKK